MALLTGEIKILMIQECAQLLRATNLCIHSIDMRREILVVKLACNVSMTILLIIANLDTSAAAQ